MGPFLLLPSSVHICISVRMDGYGPEGIALEIVLYAVTPFGLCVVCGAKLSKVFYHYNASTNSFGHGILCYVYNGSFVCYIMRILCGGSLM